jgi:hypothetical protein
MLPPALDPYRPPAVDMNVVAPVPNNGGLATRVAGGFLILRAGVSATTTMWRIVEQNSRELPGTAWAAAMILPTVLPLVVDGLLAAPLLRASVRFRVVTWVRALLAVMFPLAFVVGSVIVPRLGSRGLTGFYVQAAFTACFFAAGMILLVQRAHRRWRLVAGIACLLLYVLAQGLPRLIASGASS